MFKKFALSIAILLIAQISAVQMTNAQSNMYIVCGISASHVKMRYPQQKIHKKIQPLEMFKVGYGINLTDKYRVELTINNFHKPHFTLANYYNFINNKKIDMFILGGSFVPYKQKKHNTINSTDISIKHNIGYIIGTGISIKLNEKINLDTQFEYYGTRIKVSIPSMGISSTKRYNPKAISWSIRYKL
jgi:opacity protein-like surface antigen